MIQGVDIKFYVEIENLEKMKEIIDNEDKSRPLSDDALVDALAAQGFQLARRTITKYRQRLDIPSSRQRKEF